MPGRTREDIRHLTAGQFRRPFIDSAATATAATTLTDLLTLGRYEDNFFIGGHVYYNTDATPPDVRERVITDSVQSTGVLTVIPSDSATLDQTEPYEILPYPATAMHGAIDEALLQCYDEGWLVRPFWVGGYGGSPIYNSMFDYWDSTTSVHGWTPATSTLTRIQHTSTSFPAGPGSSAVRFNSATGTLDLDREYEYFLSDFRDHTVDVHAWLYADSASKIRVRLLGDGSVIGSTDYHSGDSSWELVSSGGLAIGSGITRVGVQIDVTTGSTNLLAGGVWLENGPSVSEYPFPIGLMPDGPDSIYQYPNNVLEDDLVGDVNAHRRTPARGGWKSYSYRDEQSASETYVLNDLYIPQGYRMRMHGDGPLTLPTTDADNVEVNHSESLLIAKLTALILDGSGNHSLNVSQQRTRDEWRLRLEEDVVRLSKGRGSSTQMVLPGAATPSQRRSAPELVAYRLSPSR